MKNKFIVFAVATAFLAVLILGCSTAAPAVSTGFPLIDIVDAEVDISNESIFNEDKEQWVRGPNTKIIGGTQHSQIVTKDVIIRLVDATIQNPIENGEDLTKWFLNIPYGLTATARALDPEAKYAAVQGATDIRISISGVPVQTINQPIKINVPYTATNRLWDFLIPPNEDLRFEVYGSVVDPVIIGGAVNLDIVPKTFAIRFGGTSLANTIPQNTDITSWFTNIPNGLKVLVAEDTKSGMQALDVVVSGKPTNQSRENTLIKIPANITGAGTILDIPESTNTRYDIGSSSSIEADNVELTVGTNWRGEQPGWGLTGPDVFKLKDFSAVGIIQISAEAVYQIGADGLYHWTGDTITYGKLMAEARRLNAHAIIDVVIDHNDVVDETIVRRHVEDGHVNTTIEAALFKAGNLKSEIDPSGGFIYEEKVSVTTRTWTGTALAITYAPAYEPAVGQGGSTGYVPALPTEKK
jgi:hypothetical protein